MASGEKTSHEKNVPKVFSVAIWSAAVISAGAFAFVVGLLAYNSIESPILASPNTQQTTCPSGTLQYAVNNYPGTTANPVTNHEAYYKKWGGDKNWRCSHLCIPGLDTSNPVMNDENLSAARNYLKTKCDASIVTNKQEFDQLSDDAMLNTIILDSLKPDCQGPNSKNYKMDFYCDNGTNQPIARTDTSYVTPTPTPTPTKTPAKVQAPPAGGGSAAEPPSQGFNALTTAPPAQDKGLIKLKSDFGVCRRKLKSYSNNYKYLSNSDKKIYDGIMNFRTITTFRKKTMQDALDKCNVLLSKISQSPEPISVISEQPVTQTNTDQSEAKTVNSQPRKITITGKIKYGQYDTSKDGLICAYLIPKTKYAYSMNYSYNRYKLKKSDDGKFSLSLQFKPDSGYKNIYLYAVDSGGILQPTRNSLLEMNITSSNQINLNDIFLGGNPSFFKGTTGDIFNTSGKESFLDWVNVKDYVKNITKHDCWTDTSF